MDIAYIVFERVANGLKILREKVGFSRFTDKSLAMQPYKIFYMHLQANIVQLPY